jgi:hypothetical protein
MEKFMSYRLMVAVSMPVMLSLIGGSSYAADPIGPAADILGVKLTMTRDQAKAFVSGSFPGTSIVELPVQIGTAEYKQSTVVGFMDDITSKEDQATNERSKEEVRKQLEARMPAYGNSALNLPVNSPSANGYGREKLFVLANPNDGATDIFGVSRYKQFTKANMPPIQALLSALTEKYGEPVSKYNTGNLGYTWMAAGFYERTQKRVRCTGPGNFLYEGAENVSPQSITQGFVTSINDINFGDTNPYLNFAKCGTVLSVDLVTRDGLYVSSMSEDLIDLTKGRAELKQFAADFFRRASAAKQEKLLQHSQNKPRL